MTINSKSFIIPPKLGKIITKHKKKSNDLERWLEFYTGAKPQKRAIFNFNPPSGERNHVKTEFCGIRKGKVEAVGKVEITKRAVIDSDIPKIITCINLRLCVHKP